MASNSPTATQQKGVTPIKVVRMMEPFSTALEEQKSKQKQLFPRLIIDPRDMTVHPKVSHIISMSHYNKNFFYHNKDLTSYNEPNSVMLKFHARVQQIIK